MCWLLVVGCWLLVVGSRLLDVGCRGLVVDSQLLFDGCRLTGWLVGRLVGWSVVGCRLLVIADVGCWLVGCCWHPDCPHILVYV